MGEECGRDEEGREGKSRGRETKKTSNKINNQFTLKFNKVILKFRLRKELFKLR